MIKRLLAFIFLTMSIGANAAVIEYTISHVSGDSLTGTLFMDNGVLTGGVVSDNPHFSWPSGRPYNFGYAGYAGGCYLDLSFLYRTRNPTLCVPAKPINTFRVIVAGHLSVFVTKLHTSRD